MTRTLSILIAIAGVAPAVAHAAECTVIDFGEVRIDAPPVATSCTFTNGTDADMSIESIKLEDDTHFGLTAPPTPYPLAGGQAVGLAVEARPMALGSIETTLEVSYRAGSAPASSSFPVRMTAIAPAIEAMPDEVDFGPSPIGLSVSRGVSLLSTGSAPLVVSEIDLPDGPFVLAEAPPLPATIQPGDGLVFRLSYRPDEVAPEQAVTMTIRSDAYGMNELHVTVRGRGATRTIRVDPGAVDFGHTPVGATARETIRIENRGELPLAISSIAIAGPGFALVGAAPDRIEGLASAEVELEFAPDEKRHYEAELRIESDDPATPVAIVALVGSSVDESGCSCRVGSARDGLPGGALVLALVSLLAKARPRIKTTHGR